MGLINKGNSQASSYIAHCGVSEHDSYGYMCELAQVSRGALAPGQADTFNVTLTTSADCPTGLCHVYVWIECAEEDPELTGGIYRRAESALFKLLVPRPDLVVQDVTLPADVCPLGSVLAITVTVQNLGGMDCDSYHMDYYVGSICIGSIDRGRLARDKVETFETQCVVPLDTPEGTYAVTTRASYTSRGDPAHSTSSSVKTTLILSVSDLRFRRAEAGARTCSPDGQLTVRSVVENIGTRASDAYTVRYYISTDTSITIKDLCIGSERFDALEKGAQRNHEMTCQLPPYVPEGNCYVGAIVTCTNDGYAPNDCGLDPVPVAVIHPAGYLCGRITYGVWMAGSTPCGTP